MICFCQRTKKLFHKNVRAEKVFRPTKMVRSVEFIRVEPRKIVQLHFNIADFHRGERLEEAKSINTSLCALSNVISALSNPEGPNRHIPYRTSKLTRVLSNCINHKSKLVIIGTINSGESDSNETFSTLQFASRCKQVQYLPVPNKITQVVKSDLEYENMIEYLREQVAERTAELHLALGHASRLPHTRTHTRISFSLNGQLSDCQKAASSERWVGGPVLVQAVVFAGKPPNQPI